jgi:hypothetical protein
MHSTFFFNVHVFLFPIFLSLFSTLTFAFAVNSDLNLLYGPLQYPVCRNFRYMLLKWGFYAMGMPGSFSGIRMVFHVNLLLYYS